MPSLFKALRPAPRLSTPAYDAVVNTARDTHWYLAGAVPDTMDGRFALLSTVVALVTLRLEREGDPGRAASILLTEAFIHDMDAQMREQGFDATLGKQVRSLVGSLASRLDRWRALLRGEGTWDEVVRRSVYRDAPVDDGSAQHTINGLKSLNDRLGAVTLDRIILGELT